MGCGSRSSGWKGKGRSWLSLFGEGSVRDRSPALASALLSLQVQTMASSLSSAS